VIGRRQQEVSHTGSTATLGFGQHAIARTTAVVVTVVVIVIVVVAAAAAAAEIAQTGLTTIAIATQDSSSVADDIVSGSTNVSTASRHEIGDIIRGIVHEIIRAGSTSTSTTGCMITGAAHQGRRVRFGGRHSGGCRDCSGWETAAVIAVIAAGRDTAGTVSASHGSAQNWFPGTPTSHHETSHTGVSQQERALVLGGSESEFRLGWFILVGLLLL
jgi:hypothetical protein